MAHKVETMAYAHEVPWHGLGFKVSNDMTPAQMLKAAKIDWSVSKRPLFIGGWQEKDGKKTAKINGNAHISKTAFALCRDEDDSELSVVGASYRPVQNKDAMGFFSKFIEAGHMTMETAGSLYNGRYVWVLAKIGSSFSLANGDKVEGYLLLCSPHVHGKSLLIQFTPVRVVCWNTLMASVGDNWGKNAKAQAIGQFRMPHSIEFTDDVKEAAEVTLGVAKEQLDGFEQVARLLSKKRVSDEDTQEYFLDVMRIDHDDFKVAAESEGMGRQKGAKMLELFHQALEKAPGQDLATARGTLWGALNAVTYVADHQQGGTRDIGLKNAWFSSWARTKRRALDLAVARAK